MKVLDVCINYGCNNKRASSGAKSKGDKLRPYCGRCHLAVRGKTTYKEGVSPVKKTFCENKPFRQNNFFLTSELHFVMRGLDKLTDWVNKS